MNKDNGLGEDSGSGKSKHERDKTWILNILKLSSV